jgi:hypothetical protein
VQHKQTEQKEKDLEKRTKEQKKKQSWPSSGRSGIETIVAHQAASVT